MDEDIADERGGATDHHHRHDDDGRVRRNDDRRVDEHHGHGAAAGTTTNTPGGTKNLASTGFSNTWLIWVGALLLLVGAGALVLPRASRRRF